MMLYLPSTRFHKATALVRSLLTTLMERKGIPGLSVAVGVDGQTVWEEGFGYADVKNSVKMTADTLVRVGSISKMITTLAVAKLIDEGKLDIDRPIQEYLPNFPVKKWNDQEVTFTTRQLMNHTAGFRHYLTKFDIRQRLANSREGSPQLPNAIIDAYEYCKHVEGSLPPEFYNRTTYQNISDSLELFQNDSLINKPGSRFHYSTFGWIIVAGIVENVVGTKFTDHMANLLGQLGFHNSVPDVNSDIRANRVRYYSRQSNGNLMNSPIVDCSWKVASGGYLSTVKDLTHLANVMLRSCYYHGTGRCDGLFRPEIVHHLWTPYQDAFDEQGTYGLGCVSYKENIVNANNVRPNHHVLHTGRGVGFGSVIHITLDGEDLTCDGNLIATKIPLTGKIVNDTFNGATVAMLANIENYNLQHIAKAIASIFISYLKR
ncbi:serine beta-lactamase-like protein LACTB, mitochondrial isoform X1 [Apostichopus japonicus]|uniref:serine beta-lactamase-like protein LACTB, mitochondrial isoform X1 n=1 Tax=Stichopus japonicus TaxID=307972 RepID=UPI003AB3D29A